MQLSAAHKEAKRAWNLMDIRKPEAGMAVSADASPLHCGATDCSLLRSNLTGKDPETL